MHVRYRTLARNTKRDRPALRQLAERWLVMVFSHRSGISLMVELQFSKLLAPVRFRYPAQNRQKACTAAGFLRFASRSDVSSVDETARRDRDRTERRRGESCDHVGGAQVYASSSEHTERGPRKFACDGKRNYPWPKQRTPILLFRGKTLRCHSGCVSSFSTISYQMHNQ